MVDKKTRITRVDRRENGANQVDEFMAGLEHPLKPQIEALRAVILGADPRIDESIKWNAPSFFIEEHFATFNLRPANSLQVVFHTGAKPREDVTELEIDDPSGLLTWVAKDRAVATFSDGQDVESKKDAVEAIVKQWIEQTGR
ncbi:MAG: DUF1801 domain-containing protein [Chloroflexi bacterium]|nr:MAG: DUF1801 domain-containing protein [Chloroflexota bacterium]